MTNEMGRTQSNGLYLLDRVSKEQKSQISNFLFFSAILFFLRTSHYSQGSMRNYMLKAKPKCLIACGEMH